VVVAFLVVADYLVDQNLVAWLYLVDQNLVA
jgi:hypothetical protein